MHNIDSTLQYLIAERVLILDGAMGTMIQRLGLTEDEREMAP